MKHLFLMLTIVVLATMASFGQYPGMDQDTLGEWTYQSLTTDTTAQVSKVVYYQQPVITVSFSYNWTEQNMTDSVPFYYGNIRPVGITTPELNKNVKLTAGGQSATKTVLEWILEMQTSPNADIIARELSKKVYNKKVANITQ